MRCGRPGHVRDSDGCGFESDREPEREPIGLAEFVAVRESYQRPDRKPERFAFGLAEFVAHRKPEFESIGIAVREPDGESVDGAQHRAFRVAIVVANVKPFTKSKRKPVCISIKQPVFEPKRQS